MSRPYTLGTPTLIRGGGGGGGSLDIPTIFEADFEAQSRKEGDRFSAMGANQVGFADQPGSAIWLHSFPIDKYGLSNSPNLLLIDGQAFEISLDEAWGDRNGQKWDMRSAKYQFGIWVKTSTIPVGVRVVALVATCHSRDYGLSDTQVIWAAEVRASPENASILFVESQNVSIRLLKLRRRWFFRLNQAILESSGQAKTEYQNTLAAGCWLALSFNLYHTAPTDIDVLESRVWLKHIGAITDPEFGLPLQVPTAYTFDPKPPRQAYSSSGSLTIRGQVISMNDFQQ